jgi:hypothetical protein
MRISSSLPAQQPIELLQFSNAGLLAGGKPGKNPLVPNLTELL